VRILPRRRLQGKRGGNDQGVGGSVRSAAIAGRAANLFTTPYPLITTPSPQSPASFLSASALSVFSHENAVKASLLSTFLPPMNSFHW